jgi:hypothetical protein
MAPVHRAMLQTSYTSVYCSISARSNLPQLSRQLLARSQASPFPTCAKLDEQTQVTSLHPVLLVAMRFY